MSDLGQEVTKALALYFGGKKRACAAALRECADIASLEAEVESGLLAPDPESGLLPAKLDHETVKAPDLKVAGQASAGGAKNLQACAAGSHDWGPYDPNIGGHECLACGTIYTRRA